MDKWLMTSKVVGVFDIETDCAKVEHGEITSDSEGKPSSE